MGNSKKIHDNIETYIQGLKSLGKTEYAYGDLLVQLILDKLPDPLSIEIARDHGDGAWTLKDIISAIYTEIQAGEAGTGNDISRSQSQSTHSRVESATSTLSSLHVGAKRGYSTPQCVYCKGSHSSTTCLKIKDKPQRHDFVKNKMK